MPEDSLAHRTLSYSKWVVAVAVLFFVVFVGRLGSERFLGMDDDVVTWAVIGLFLAWLVARQFLSEGTGVETDPETPPTVGEHYRPAGETARVDPGVYRVVGVGREVTLLRVADPDSGREFTGETARVDPETVDASFEAAEDPDAGFYPVANLRNLLSGVYWSVRRFF